MALLVGDVVTNFVAKIDNVTQAVEGIQSRLDKLAKQTFSVRLGADETKAVRAIQRIDLNLARVRDQLERFGLAMRGVTKSATANIIKASSVTRTTVGKAANNMTRSLAEVGKEATSTGNQVARFGRNAVQSFLDWSGVLTAISVISLPGFVAAMSKVFSTTENTTTAMAQTVGTLGDVNVGLSTTLSNLQTGLRVLTQTDDIFLFFQQNAPFVLTIIGAVGDFFTGVVPGIATTTLDVTWNLLNGIGSALQTVGDGLVRALGFLFPGLTAAKEITVEGQKLISIGDLLLPRLAVIGTFATTLLGINFALRAVVNRIRALAGTRPNTILGRAASLINTIFIAVSNLVSPVEVVANRIASILGVVSLLSSGVLSLVFGVTTLFTGVNAIFGVISIVTPLLQNLFLRLRTGVFRVSAALGDGRARFILFFGEMRDAFGFIAQQINLLRQALGKRFNFLQFFVQVVESIRSSLGAIVELMSTLVQGLLKTTEGVVVNVADRVQSIRDTMTTFPSLMASLVVSGKRHTSNLQNQKTIGDQIAATLANIANNFWPTILSIPGRAIETPFRLLAFAARRAFRRVRVLALEQSVAVQKRIRSGFASLFGDAIPGPIKTLFGFVTKTSRTFFSFFTKRGSELNKTWANIWKGGEKPLERQFVAARDRIQKLEKQAEEQRAAGQKRERELRAAVEKTQTVIEAALQKRKQRVEEFTAAQKTAEEQFKKNAEVVERQDQRIASANKRVQITTDVNLALGRQLAVLEQINAVEGDIPNKLLLELAASNEVLKSYGEHNKALQFINKALDTQQKKAEKLAETTQKREQVIVELTKARREQTAIEERLAKASAKEEQQKGRVEKLTEAVAKLKSLRDTAAKADESQKKQAVADVVKQAREVRALDDGLKKTVDTFLTQERGMKRAQITTKNALDVTDKIVKSFSALKGQVTQAAAAVDVEKAALENTRATVKSLESELDKLANLSRRQQEAFLKAAEAAEKLRTSSDFRKLISDQRDLTTASLENRAAQTEAAVEVIRNAEATKKAALEEISLQEAILERQKARLHQVDRETRFIARRGTLILEEQEKERQALERSVEQTRLRTDKNVKAIETEIQALRRRQELLVTEAALERTPVGQRGRQARDKTDREFEARIRQQTKFTEDAHRESAQKVRDRALTITDQTATAVEDRVKTSAERGRGVVVDNAEKAAEEMLKISRKFANEFIRIIGRSRGKGASNLLEAIANGNVNAFVDGVTKPALNNLQALQNSFFGKSRSEFEKIAQSGRTAFKTFAGDSPEVKQRFDRFITELERVRNEGQRLSKELIAHLQSVFGLKLDITKPTDTFRAALFKLAVTFQRDGEAAFTKSANQFINTFAKQLKGADKVGVRDAMFDVVQEMAKFLPQSLPQEGPLRKAALAMSTYPDILGKELLEGRSNFHNLTRQLFDGSGTIMSDEMREEMEMVRHTLEQEAQRLMESGRGRFRGVFTGIADAFTGSGTRALLRGGEVVASGFQSTFERLANFIESGKIKDRLGDAIIFTGNAIKKIALTKVDEIGRAVGLRAQFSLTDLIKTLTATTGAATAAFALFLNGVTPIVPVVLALAGSVDGLIKVFGGLTNTVFGAARTLGLVTGILHLNIREFADGVRGLGQLLRGVVQVIVGAAATVKGAFDPIFNILRGTAKLLVVSYKLVERGITAFVSGSLLALGRFTSFLEKRVQPIVAGVFNYLVKLPVKAALAPFRFLASEMRKVSASGFGLLAKDTGRLLGRGFVNFGKTLLKGVRGAYQALRKEVPKQSMLVAGLIGSGLKRGAGLVAGAFNSVLNVIKLRLPASPPPLGPLAGNFLFNAGAKIIELISGGIVKRGGNILTNAVSTVMRAAFLPLFAPSAFVFKGLQSLIHGFEKLAEAINDIGSVPGIRQLKELATEVREIGLAAERFAPAGQDLDEFTQKFDAFSKAAKATIGLEGSRVETIFVTLERQLAEAVNDPLGDAAEKFQRLGVDLEAFARGNEDIIDVTLKLADSVHSGALNATELQEAFDLTAATFGPLKNLLVRGGEEIRHAMGRAAELGVLIDKDAVDNAIEFNKQLTEFEDAVEGIKRIVLEEFAPPVTKFFHDVLDLWAENRDRILSGLRIIFNISKTIFDFVLGKVNEWITKRDSFFEALGILVKRFFRLNTRLFSQFIESISRFLPPILNIIRSIAPVVVELFSFITDVLFPRLILAARRAGQQILNALFGSEFLQGAGAVIDNVVTDIEEGLFALARQLGVETGPTIKERRATARRQAQQAAEETMRSIRAQTEDLEGLRKRLEETVEWQERFAAANERQPQRDFDKHAKSLEEDRRIFEDEIKKREEGLQRLRRVAQKQLIDAGRTDFGSTLFSIDEEAFTRQEEALANRADKILDRVGERVTEAAKNIAPEIGEIGRIALEELGKAGATIGEELRGTLLDLGGEETLDAINSDLDKLMSLFNEAAEEASKEGNEEGANQIRNVRDQVAESLRNMEALLFGFRKKVNETRGKIFEVTGLDIIQLDNDAEGRIEKVREIEVAIEQLARTNDKLAERAKNLSGVEFVAMQAAVLNNKLAMEELNRQLERAIAVADQVHGAEMLESLAESFLFVDGTLKDLVDKEVETIRFTAQLEENLAQVGARLRQDFATGEVSNLADQIDFLAEKAVQAGGEVANEIRGMVDALAIAVNTGNFEEAIRLRLEILKRIAEKQKKEQQDAEDTRFDELAETTATAFTNALRKAVEEFVDNEGKIKFGALVNSLFAELSKSLVDNLIKDIEKDMVKTLKDGFKEVFAFAGEHAGAIATAVTAAIAIALTFLTNQANKEVQVAKETLDSVVESTERVRGIISGETTIKLKEVADNLLEALETWSGTATLRRIEVNTRVGGGAPVAGLAESVGGV